MAMVAVAVAEGTDRYSAAFISNPSAILSEGATG